MKPRVLVFGATGQQGGAAARHLLDGGFRVRVFVRDSSNPQATRLAEAGAETVVGDMDDRESLDTAIRGVEGVFSVQPSFIPPRFAKNQLQRGLNVADAAAAAGVQHLVYASVASVDRNMGIPHWDIQWQIEQHIRRLRLPFTMLRPTMFMENHADATYGVSGEHSVIRTIPSNVVIQHVAISDIGAFAALAFGNPDYYVGRAIELAGDELTVEQIISAITRATGRRLLRVRSRPVPPQAHGGGGTTEHLVNYGGWQADVPALRALHPGLMTFNTWLVSGGGAVLIGQLLARTPAL
jgi:uncharacterized protein YbjT (DUF2867 family)